MDMAHAEIDAKPSNLRRRRRRLAICGEFEKESSSLHRRSVFLEPEM